MKSILQNKKGSHVEVILSIVIFIGFFIFLFIVLEPRIKYQEDEKFVLDFIENNLIGRVSSNLTTATIQLRASYSPLAGKNCLQITDLGSGTYLMVTNGTEGLGSSSNAGNVLINWAGQTDDFFKIYYSEEEFNSPAYTGTDCDSPTIDTEYIVGLVSIESEIFESGIKEFINQSLYDNEYSKTEIGIPLQNEFSMAFTYENGTIIDTLSTSIATEIYSQKIPIEYIDEEAQIKVGELSITIW